MELKNKKINFLGDSITEGHGSSDVSKRYTNLIAEKTGAICRNYGIGGTRIARQIDKNDCYPLDFNKRFDTMDDDADIIVVFGGTNDYGHGDAPFGKFSDRTPDTFYGALHSLYIGLLNKYPDSQILIITPLHRDNELNSKWWPDSATEKTDVNLIDYVNAIKEVAKYYSLPVLDLFATYGVQPAVEIIKQKYMPDGLHPNDLGYMRLSDKIIKALENL